MTSVPFTTSITLKEPRALQRLMVPYGKPANDVALSVATINDLLNDPRARFLSAGAAHNDDQLPQGQKAREAERAYWAVILRAVERFVRYEPKYVVRDYVGSYAPYALLKSHTARALYRAQDHLGLHRFIQAAIKHTAINSQRTQRAQNEADHDSIDELCVSIPQPTSLQEVLGVPPNPADLPRWASDQSILQSGLPVELVDYLLPRNLFTRVVALARVGYDRVPSKGIIEILGGAYTPNAVDLKWSQIKKELRRRHEDQAA